MPTKLSRYCEGIMEAAWLAAVLVVPIFFNIYSSRIFEPDKIALLRSLALIILASWLVKIIEVGRMQWESLKATGSPWKSFLKTPMVAPVLALLLVYIIATIFSITPEISLWGSYQRLQGTYTTFSYLIIFGAIVGNMRQRSQVDRLITVIIIGSLPVSLYGVLQRYRLDTVPWGGDTVQRIAANLGNSIFVAAYLIMVFPLTLARIVEKFRIILKVTESVFIPMILATAYVFIAALQVIAIYFSGSRGPALGWMASLFVFFLLLSLFWRRRWLTIGMVAVTVTGAITLFIFNLEGGPLERLRSSPVVGRFGTLLDSESASALVRQYIWEGVTSLVSSHEPLKFPDGSGDRFNIIRPLIGYGPESMYVAYNQFYIPDLGKVERRNASPDRSHNETWDSVVITGAVGLVAYFIVFAMVFYYGFKWLGLIIDQKSKYLFFGLYLGSGLSGALIFSVWRGSEYLGLGLPFGVTIGLIVYIVLIAFSNNFEMPKNEGQAARFLIVLGVISSILAYFIESNFGISIAVTRTYFWTYTSVMVVVGYYLPRLGEYGFTNGVDANVQNPDLDTSRILQNSMSQPVRSVMPSVGGRTIDGESKKRRRDEKQGKMRANETRQNRTSGLMNWQIQSLVGAGLLAIIMVTLGFNYISNEARSTSAFSIIGELISSRYFGILLLLVSTWIIASVVISSESMINETSKGQTRGLFLRIINILGLSGILTIIYYLWHAGHLANLASASVNSIEDLIIEVQHYENLLTNFYFYLFLLVFALAIFIPYSNIPVIPSEKVVRQPTKFASSWISVVAMGLFTMGAMYFASTSNLRVIQADIAFKIGDSFAQPGSWGVATRIYDHAIDLAPSEDYYYLFLGRANLEEGKTIQDSLARDQYILDAKDNLLKAQSINPLNTDHTANLARLYSMWASYTSDETSKTDRAEAASGYFENSVTLSPNNARLWSEWALHELTNNSNIDKARDLLATALEKDPEYDWAYALLGDFSLRSALQTQDPVELSRLLSDAAENYEQALKFINPFDQQNRISYLLSLGSIYSQLGKPDQAINVYTQAIEFAPTNPDAWQIEQAIAQEFLVLNDKSNAVLHLQKALQTSPEDQKERLQQMIDQIGGI